MAQNPQVASCVSTSIVQKVQVTGDRSPLSRRPAIPTWLLAGGLICAFGLWFSWAPLVVFLQQAQPQLPVLALFSLLASTGLSGLCLRLTLGFLTRSGDEPLVFAVSQALMVLTALGFYLLLAQGSPDLRALHGLALLSGVGGGCFSVLVYGPKTRGEPLRIDLVSSLGQLGIVISFLILPALVLIPLPFSQASSLSFASSHLLGRVSAGEPIWLGWFGLFWGLPSLICLLLSSRYVRAWARGQPLFFPAGIKRLFRALISGLGLALPGCWWIYAVSGAEGNWSLVPELTVVGLLALFVMAFWLGFRWTGRAVHMRMFDSRHTWTMSLLWLASLGSFLGYAMVLPLLMSQLSWGESLALKAEEPGVFMYAWMLPLAGALMRPLGSWCVYRWGGQAVTHVCLAILTLSALWVAHQLEAIQEAAYPRPLFSELLLAFGALFIASGLTHAALICRLPQLFPETQQRDLGIWLSAIALVGVVYLPLVLGDHFVAGEPSLALLGSAIFFGLCLLVSLAFYGSASSSLDTH